MMQVEVLKIEVAKLCMQPGQILAIRADRPLLKDQISSITSALIALVPDGVKVAVIDRGLDIIVIDPPTPPIKPAAE